MKKILMMAMMAATATTAFAQDALVKDAKKLLTKSDFDAAISTLAPALTSSETLDKAAAWNLQTDIYYQQFSKLQEEAIKSGVTGGAVDSVKMFDAAINAWEAALKCDEVSQLPDAKGKVKNKFRSANQLRFKQHGVALVQGGQHFYNLKDYDKALKAWKLYLGLKDSPIFADVKDMPQDPFYYDIAYYVAFLSYQQKYFDDAVSYAKLTAQDPQRADDANEILLFAMKDNCKTQEDTLKYVEHVKELHKAQPEVERYFNLLVDYYSRVQDNTVMEKWAEEEVALTPQNKTAWFLKGYALMAQEKWDDAVEAYKKGIEVDPNYTECYFNIGVCMNSKARALQDQLADKNGNITTADFEKVKDILRESKGFLEKAKEQDPIREKCNWAYPLYQIYYSLGDEANANEMEKLVNNR